MKLRITLTIFFLFLALSTILSQGKNIRIFGYIIDDENRGVENATVFVNGNSMANTNRNGYYELNTSIKDTVVIEFSRIGYKRLSYIVNPKSKKVIQMTVILSKLTKELKEVHVNSNRHATTQLQTIDPTKYQLMPNASGSFESLLLAFTGVTSNNELSSQYNVRGGNFDENIVYVNGTEVYRPILVRAGQQEGLSFINPNMVQKVNFSSGGFNAEYGDKMSSVLDVTYKKPKKFEGAASVSLLGASAYVGSANKRFTQIHGIRYKTSQYLLGTLDTKGSYKPNFIDYQTYMTYKWSKKWEADFLGNFSRNSYTFIPYSKSTAFGTYNMAEKLTVYFDGQERDLFQTLFGSANVTYKPALNLKLSLGTSGFTTNENETYDIMGQYELSEMKMNNGKAEKGEQLGIGTYHEHARNRLKASVLSLYHKGMFIKDMHTVKWGLNVQKEQIVDKIREWEWRDSAGYSLPRHPKKQVNLHYNSNSKHTLESWRSSAYLQDTYRWDSDAAYYSVTGGVRAAYWSFNKELIVSPRASLSIVPHWKEEFNFRLATGVYYQSPFYKEVRKPIADKLGNRDVELNRDIKSQRSYHFVMGGDYFFRVLGRPFKFTTEAYLKLADRVISYSVDNVRIRYSGENDAKAYTAGVDFKLFGELVPGTDSWLNFSLMRSKEDLLHDYYVKDNITYYPGEISRPNEQRFSVSMLFTDYLPNNPKYKLFLKAIYSDGLPIGAPNSPRYMSDKFRLNSYKRVDIGVSRVLIKGSDKMMKNRFFRHLNNVWVNFEIFNLFNFKNENSIFWVSDIKGTQHGSPNYLTGRQINVKLSVDF